MVPFAGWMMPVQYNNASIKESHLHCRSHAALFDVSHMLQVYMLRNISICFESIYLQINLSGKKVADLIKAVSVADVDALKEHHSVYTLMTTNDGGVIDDAILTCTGQDSYYLVSNASRAGEVIKRLKVITIKVSFCNATICGYSMTATA